MTSLQRMLPQSMAGQMIAILMLALFLLLTTFTLLEIIDRGNALEWARRDTTLRRLKRIKLMLELLKPEQIDQMLALTSHCHEGYRLSDTPFPMDRHDKETDALQLEIAEALALARIQVKVGYAVLTQGDFSYFKCDEEEIILPLEAIVISVQLYSGLWLHAEIHPHEWHLMDMVRWMIRSIAAFLFIGGFAVFFMRRLNKPLNQLTNAATCFGAGLEVSPVEACGPLDLRRAIHAFNAMQQQVANEVEKRMHTLAAISHDLRTPLTALRLKAALIEDPVAQADLTASITKMERMIISALEYLSGESRSEPMRMVDLSALIESACHDFSEIGHPVTFKGAHQITYRCRLDALTRAIRNLVENALKYGTSAAVSLTVADTHLDITIADQGRGIPIEKHALVLEPFTRLSKARESNKGGFGLGLAVVKAITSGHDGVLLLETNQPSGLMATIRLPIKKTKNDRF